MLARIRRKLSMVERALLFCRGHPDTDPGYVAMLARLEDLVARAAELSLLELSGDQGEHLATRRRVEARRKLNLLPRHLDNVGVVATLDHPELMGTFEAPAPRLPNRIFLATAREMRKVANQHQELLLGYSLGTGFLELLDQALNEFHEAGAAASRSRLWHIGARGE